MSRNIFDNTPDEEPEVEDSHLTEVAGLPAELDGAPKALCPRCKTVSVKLKARIDGDNGERRIERYLLCTNCNIRITQ